MTAERRTVRNPETGREMVPGVDDEMFAPAWRPEVGEILVGKVDGVDFVDNKFGRYPVVTILKDDGERWAFHAFHTVARNELNRWRPRRGERLRVAYLDDAKQHDYHSYRVRVLDREVRDEDWDRAFGPAEQGRGAVKPVVDDGEPPF